MKKHLTKEIVDKSNYQRKVRIGVPGVQTLHHKTPKEIGEALSEVFSNEDNVVEMKYVLGKYIELTIENSPPDHIMFKQVY